MRLQYSIYVGHQNRTGSMICLTEEGAVKARGFKRLIESERFLKAELDKVKGLPWDLAWQLYGI